MPDREKVIGHLNDCMEASRRDNTWVFVRKDIVADALALLKKQQEQIDRLIEENASNAEMAEGLNELLKEQEAVEPRWFIDAHNPAGAFVCGACGERIIEKNIDFYCSKCGKPVLWEGR